MATRSPRRTSCWARASSASRVRKVRSGGGPWRGPSWSRCGRGWRRWHWCSFNKEGAMDIKLRAEILALLLLIAAFPIISIGTDGGNDVVWWVGLACLVLGG